MEEEKETLKGQVSGLREGQINRAGQPQPQSNEPDRNPQEKRLLQARSSIDEIVCESEKPSGFFSSEQNEQNDVHNVHHVHTSESTQELNNAELEKHVATVESIIERAKEDAGLYASTEFIGAAKFIRDAGDAGDEAWIRCRVKIKREKPSGVLLSDIDEATRPDSETGGERNVAAVLAKLVVDCCELLHDANTHDTYVTTKADNVTLKVGTVAFFEFVSYAFYKNSGRSSASEAALKQMASSIAGLCKYEGKQGQVFKRVARYEDAYYLSMGDEKNRAFEFTPIGWRIIDKPPITFCKSSSAAPFPEPVAGGDIKNIWEFCNIPEECRLLVLAWILECWRVDTPYPIIMFCGVQGSAKTSTHRFIVMFADPSTAPLRKAPKNDEDIVIAASNSHAVSFENMSYLSNQTQDTLCTMSTGGALSKRRLYTDAEETVIDMKSPVSINGIVPVITAQDATERSIYVELPKIERYQSEGEIQAVYEASRSKIQHALFDLFVKTLAKLPAVKTSGRERMVDFCLLGEAMAQSMGFDAGVFLTQYNENRKDSVFRSIESSPVASAVLEMAQESAFDDLFHGTYKELLDKLIPYKGGDNEGWPKSEKGLANALKRNIPALYEVDVIVQPEQGKKQGNKGRTVTIKKREHGERREHDSAQTSSKEKKSVESVDDGSPF